MSTRAGRTGQASLAASAASSASENPVPHLVTVRKGSDGIALAQLMVTHNIGVQDRETYVIKRVDEDFFEEAQG